MRVVLLPACFNASIGDGLIPSRLKTVTAPSSQAQFQRLNRRWSHSETYFPRRGVGWQRVSTPQ